MAPGFRSGAYPRGRNKFGAKRARDINNRQYDSTAERDRAADLTLLERAGEIAQLELQPVATLTPDFHYRADVSYLEKGRMVWEDVKGVETERFKVVTQAWRALGPGLLRITKRSTRRHEKRGFVVTREIMPSIEQARAVIAMLVERWGKDVLP